MNPILPAFFGRRLVSQSIAGYCLATGGLLFSASAYAAPPPNATGRHIIAFSSNDADGSGHRGGIFVMRDDGTMVRQLTRFTEVDLLWGNDPRRPLPDDQPSVSPDGRKVVFTSKRSGNYEIWVIDINGGNLKQLTTSSAVDVDPVWSPDGQFIAWCSDKSTPELAIWQMRADGTDQHRLTPGNQEDADPAWHPDGKTIVFSRKVGLGNYDLFQLRRSSATDFNPVISSIVTRNGNDRFPTINPDGTRIAYSSERAFDIQSPFGHIVAGTFTSTGAIGTLVNLTDRNQALGGFRRGGASPTWSPDGSKVFGYYSEGILITAQQNLMRLGTAGGPPTSATRVPRPFELNINPCYGWELDTDGDGRPDHLENANVLLSTLDFAARRDSAGAFGGRSVLPDLNHDGVPDLAVLGGIKPLLGSPEDAVFLAGGTANGLVVGSNVAIGNTSDDLPTYLKRGDFPTFTALSIAEFENLAAGDFDGDGFKDLAIIGTQTEGIVATEQHDRIWVHSGRDGRKQVVEGQASGTSFGVTVTTGDFDADGRDDLVVGVPEATGTLGGTVRLYRGTTPGGILNPGLISTAAVTLLSSQTEELRGAFLGTALAAGDFNGDGIKDLAIGAPGQDEVVSLNGTPTTLRDRGAIHVLFGSTNAGLISGLVIRPASLPNPPIELNRTDLNFGAVLAAGDFDGNGVDDLVVGLPLLSADGKLNSGIVLVYAGGLFPNQTPATPQFFSNPASAVGANFGAALQVGDFSGDGRKDLAIAAPGSDRVWIIHSTVRSLSCITCRNGLNLAARVELSPANFGLNLGATAAFPRIATGGFPTKTPSDSAIGRFGVDNAKFATLSAADIDKDGQSELFIGVPGAEAFVRDDGTTSFGVLCVRAGAKVGQFTLTPQSGVAAPGIPTTLRLVWRHPRQWRLLNQVHLRFSTDAGFFSWVRFDEAANTLSLYDDDAGDFGPAARLGESRVLANASTSIDVSTASLVGSGPQGLDMTMNLPVTFKGPASGQTLRVEVFATDDDGGSQGWNNAGTVQVLASPAVTHLQAQALLGSEAIRITVLGAAGRRVRIESSTNLQAWTPVVEVENPTGSVTQDLPVTGGSGLFFRVVAP